MLERAQFDDRIRNLIALAQDGSEHSRTLLFSHISDLFLQKRPMASAVQIRMLTEILKELLNQVALSTRQEIASALYALANPPEQLIDIMCEDVVEVSGPLLEKANLPDEKLIHIIRYGTEPHRIHISRRFGLSPLVRHELEKAYQRSESSKLKYSLNELDRLAEDDAPDMDEETTANILELLRAQKIHKGYPEQQEENLSPVVTAPLPGQPEENKTKTESPAEKTTGELPRSPETPFKDNDNAFRAEIAANDAAALPDSHIQMVSAPPDMGDDIWQKVQETRHETSRQREFVRTVADWFWEVDRSGLISFISEEACIVFGRNSPALIGEDFISLCTSPRQKENTDNDTNDDTNDDTGQTGKTFESLFEHRSSFRNIPVCISSPNGETTLWYISAIAIFDIHTGRFTGFRGSARAKADDEQSAMKGGLQEKALENYITEQAARAVSQDMTPPEYPAPKDLIQRKAAENARNEEVAEELLQNLSHEFRTPLNAIIGFSEMIDIETWGPVNKQYHQNIKNILTAAAQLKEAVNDVLDSARLEAGLMQISPESFSLKSVLKNCRENVEALAAENNVHMMENDNNIDVILYNDKQSVELCLTKMLASIIKRAAGGETISPSVLINSNAQVRIEFPVLGARIDEKNAGELFKKFKTEPGEHKNIPPGDIKYTPEISSGFGLSIAQRLAHMIGGDISHHTAQGYITHLVLTLSNHDPVS